MINYIDIGSSGGLSYPWRKNYISNLLEIDALSGKCIFDKEISKNFFITKKKRCSSLFRLNKKVVNLYFDKKKAKRKIYNHKVEKVINLKCIRLDSLLEEEYDFLKVDTQGADFNVIKSCGVKIKSFVGIQFEAFFIKFYKGIVLFNSIEKYLISHGFYFFKTVLNKGWFGDFLFINRKTNKIEKKDFIIKLYCNSSHNFWENQNVSMR